MRSIAFGFGCLLLTSGSFAQKPPIKFGDVGMDELTMKKCAYDSSASAVVLVDYGNTTMPFSQNTGFLLNFERIIRLKIITKDGYDQANFSISLFHEGNDKDKLLSVKGITFNLENGKLVETKLGKDGIFQEAVSENFDRVKITMPNVKEGSVIDLTYQVSSNLLFNFKDWDFQTDIPVVVSQYNASIPEFFHYDSYMQGYLVLEENSHTVENSSLTFTSMDHSGGSGFAPQSNMSQGRVDMKIDHYRWATKNVPAFKHEPYIATADNYLSRIMFELAYEKWPNEPVTQILGTWQKLNQQLLDLGDFGGELDGNAFLKRAIEQVGVGVSDTIRRIAAITDYVKSQIKWNGQSRLFASGVRKAFDNHTGNSADVNLALVCMLRKAGFSASPVIISTRSNGFVRESVPELRQFNSVISLVNLNGKALLLDATERMLPFDILPERDLNDKGFIIDASNSGWIRIIPREKSKTFAFADLTLDEETGVHGVISITHNGYDGFDSRQAYLNSGEENYINKRAGAAQWTITKSTFENLDDINKPFIETHDVALSGQGTSAGDIYFINPVTALRLSENPFKLEKREYPVDFSSPQEKTYTLKFTIPDGYAVDELPQSKVFMLPQTAARFIYNVSQIGNTVNVTASLSINKTLFNPDEYGNLREFYNLIVAKEAEQIVLKKL